MPYLILLVIVGLALYYLLIPALIGLAIVGLVYVTYQIYANAYFNGKKFKAAKESIEKYISNCNELNAHIEDLKKIDSNIQAIDYGSASLSDNSQFNYSRTQWSSIVKNSNTFNCSLTVCKNANDQPFKYLCKYFEIPINEETLVLFETLLNNFDAVEQGKKLLLNERDATIESIHNSIPSLIMTYSKKRVIKELGFKDIDLSDLYFPSYTFHYTSPGGNSSMKSDIKMNIDNLNKFVTYLSELIKFKNSIAGQRALMTSSLREKIKERDNYTCKYCGISSHTERNLLLEIDHIKPLAKGGITTETNLQTLCWKCNRTKGSKLIEPMIQND